MHRTFAIILMAITAISTTAAANNIGTATDTTTRTVELRIVETSDVHGHFFPYDFINRQPIGGTLSRVSTYVGRLRQRYGNRLLLIDNGDILQGQPTCYYSNYIMPHDTNIAARIVNFMGYDAETVGNHDIEPGHAVYDKWIREVRCPVLGANIVNKETGLPYVRPYSVHHIDGARVVILGMTTPTIPFWLHESLWQGLEFTDMVACAKKWIKVIREQEQPDVIIGLFHSGKNGGIATPHLAENASEAVAREVPGFDVVFYGHDHTLHKDWVKNVEGDSVLCLDPSCYANYVGDATITLNYDSQGQLLTKMIDGRLTCVATEDVDQTLVAHFQNAIDSVKHYVNRRIGYFDTAIDAHDCFFGPSPFTDYIHNVQLRLTGADISFNAPLTPDAHINRGPISMGDLFNLYRYENLICVLNLTGDEVRRHLEMSYDLWANTMTKAGDHALRISKGAWNATNSKRERWGFDNITFNFDSAAGIDYEVDLSKPDGEKVRILRMSNGKPFDPKATYRVVMNSYRANGGGELLTRGAGIPQEELAQRLVYQSERDQRYYLMLDIERQRHVMPKANRNWRFVPESWTRQALRRDRKLLFGN